MVEEDTNDAQAHQQSEPRPEEPRGQAGRHVGDLWRHARKGHLRVDGGRRLRGDIDQGRVGRS